MQNKIYIIRRVSVKKPKAERIEVFMKDTPTTVVDIPEVPTEVILSPLISTQSLTVNQKEMLSN